MSTTKFAPGVERKQCLFILKNGNQCKSKEEPDTRANGFCYRHHTIQQEQPKDAGWEQIREQFRQKPFLSTPKPEKDEGWEQFREQFRQKPFRSTPNPEKDEGWEQFREQFRQKPFRSTSKPEKEQPLKGILATLGITTKVEWKNWILKNHPDKGCETSVFIEVLKAGRIAFE